MLIDLYRSYAVGLNITGINVDESIALLALIVS